MRCPPWRIAPNGYCRYSPHGEPVEIAINTSLPPLHQAKTLAHELAHALLHSSNEYSEHRGDMELEAESTRTSAQAIHKATQSIIDWVESQTESALNRTLPSW